MALTQGQIQDLALLLRGQVHLSNHVPEDFHLPDPTATVFNADWSSFSTLFGSSGTLASTLQYLKRQQQYLVLPPVKTKSKHIIPLPPTVYWLHINYRINSIFDLRDFWFWLNGPASLYNSNLNYITQQKKWNHRKDPPLDATVDAWKL